MRRHLFGPVSAAIADQNLYRARQVGACLAFGPGEGTDLAIGAADTWEDVCARLPAGWLPDFLALYLPYTTIPPCLWTAPVPLVGLAADWNLLWHGYRHLLRRCDLILTDTIGAEVLAREGITHARAANLFGCDRAFLEEPVPDGPRDIDLLFVGNLHQPVQRERVPWLARLARLSDRWRVIIATGVFRADYRALLRRARIVFNRSIRGECNKRVFEAAASGALLFQEAGNREVAAYFRDRQECVCYTEDNLEQLLDHYLTHEGERQAIAAAARARVQEYGFDTLWEQQLAQAEPDWHDLLARRRGRTSPAAPEDLLVRTWQALGSSDSGDPSLPDDLTAALEREPDSAGLRNALGLAVAREALGRGPLTASVAEQAAGHFRGALRDDPSHVVAGLNLAEALVVQGQDAEAALVARRTLAVLNRRPAPGADLRDSGHFPPAFDVFRVEWERAAWTNAGRPEAEARAKRDLLRWRLHTLVAALTGDLVHYHEAVIACPGLPLGRAALGCALGRAGRSREALPHLRQAVADNPLDRDAARALFHALGEAGDADGHKLERNVSLLRRQHAERTGYKTKGRDRVGWEVRIWPFADFQ